MEIRPSIGRLLLILVFLFVGFNVIRSPATYVSKVNKTATSLEPILKANIGLELPVEDIKASAKAILQVLAGLSILGAFGTALRYKAGVHLLIVLVVIATFAEMSVLITEPAQNGLHAVSLLKTLGVLGGLIVLATARDTANEAESKEKND